MKTPVRLWVRLKVTDLVTQTARITLTEKLEFADDLRGMTHYWYWGMDAEAADARSALAEIDRVIRLDSAFTNQNKHLYRLAAGTDLVLGDLALEKDFPALGPDTPAPSPGGPDVFASGPVADAPKGPYAKSSGPGLGADIPANGPIGAPATGPGAEISAPGTGLFALDCLVRERRSDRETGFAERLNARLKGVAVSNMKCGEVWRLVVSASAECAALEAVERMLVSRSRREGLLLNPHYQTWEILATTRLDAGGSAATVRAKE
ncbi:MAG: hypothetical protein WC674_08430 [Candidatus Krumholzibacteriia bacterium]